MQITNDRIDNLKAVRAYIEKGWTQDAEARNEFGEAVTPVDPTAIEWDLCGAMEKVYYEVHYYVANEDSPGLSFFLEELTRPLNPEWVDVWNDIPEWESEAERTKEEVIELIDKGVARLEMEEAQRIVTILTDARDTIEKGWTQEVLARDEEGRPIYPQSPEAVEWCGIGALCKAISEHKTLNLGIAQHTVERIIYPVGLSAYNDTIGRTKEDMLDVFGRAIEMSVLESVSV